MGTSASYRAPAVPRWQAFTAALQAQLPLERVRSELFNAGWEWEEQLAAPAVAAYAVALLDAHANLPDRLRQVDRPEVALQALVAEARALSAAEPASAATAMAERAFASLLTRAIATGQSLAQTGPDQAAEQFTASRGSAGDLIAGYVGELLGQYARHVTAREAGRLTEGEGEGRLTVSGTRRLTRSVAAAAEQVGREALPPVADGESVRAAWRPMIRDAFARGRRLPERRA